MLIYKHKRHLLIAKKILAENEIRMPETIQILLSGNINITLKGYF